MWQNWVLCQVLYSKLVCVLFLSMMSFSQVPTLIFFLLICVLQCWPIWSYIIGASLTITSSSPGLSRKKVCFPNRALNLQARQSFHEQAYHLFLPMFCHGHLSITTSWIGSLTLFFLPLNELFIKFPSISIFHCHVSHLIWCL